MKILCIDMNIIMSPCIRLYMDRVAKHENPEIVWRNLEKSMGIGAHLSYDAGILINLAKVIKANKDARFVMTEHQMENVAVIEEMIEEERKPDAANIRLTNIDFFSDLGNPEERSRFEFGVYDDDSWLGYLGYKYPEFEYRWMKAAESCVHEAVAAGTKLEILPFAMVENIPSDFDIIILSHSGQYVPYCYRHLGILLGFCSEKNIVAGYIYEKGQAAS